MELFGVHRNNNCFTTEFLGPTAGFNSSFKTKPTERLKQTFFSFDSSFSTKPSALVNQLLMWFETASALVSLLKRPTNNQAFFWPADKPSSSLSKVPMTTFVAIHFTAFFSFHFFLAAQVSSLFFKAWAISVHISGTSLSPILDFQRIFPFHSLFQIRGIIFIVHITA